MPNNIIIQASWKNYIAIMLALPVSLLLQACGSLPNNVVRSSSFSLAPNNNSPLVQLARNKRPRDVPATHNGFVFLDTADKAYAARLALIQQAKYTLDIQYYAIHNDPSTDTLIQAIQDAAKRGVRVRILVDDFNSSGKHAQVFRLGFMPNIEMRVFNPIAGGRALGAARPVLALRGLSRLQQRMHNKLLLTDNAIGILGGRNLSESYFGKSYSSNFIDLDVLVLGNLVQDMSDSFDTYWNHKLSYPVQSLIDLIKLKHLKDTVRNTYTNKKLPLNLPSAMNLTKLPWVWAPAQFWVDSPKKFIPAKRKLSLPNSTVYKLAKLLEQAKEDVLLVSAYLVPDKHILDILKKLHQRGVKVRVLTNSLASNDAPAAHIGYARWRKRLVDSGIELYETRSSQRKRKRNGFGSSGNARHRSLHVKAAVIDNSIVVIGSMNLDQRSHLYNSEVSVMMLSAELSKELTRTLELLLNKDAWRVVRSPKGNLIWKSVDAQYEEKNQPEPNASISSQFMIKLIAPFIRTRWL